MRRGALGHEELVFAYVIGNGPARKAFFHYVSIPTTMEHHLHYNLCLPALWGCMIDALDCV